MSRIEFNKTKKRGFTLIETLVVLFIISMLLVLLILAIQYAREASRRLSCLNNLKQIGVALASYETKFTVYPQGGNSGSFSAHVMLFPQLEQAILFDSINFSVKSSMLSISENEINVTVGNICLNVLLCPSDPDSLGQALTNYAWNGGVGLQLTSFNGTFGAVPGYSPINVRPADITDGLSNTAAMTEWKIGRIQSSDDSTVIFNVKQKFSDSEYSSFIEACENSNRQLTDFGSWKKNAHWIHGMYGSTLSNFNSRPNSLSCYYANSINFGNWPASSYHAGGANVLFHDGRVSFLKNSISLSVWKSVSTRAGSDNY